MKLSFYTHGWSLIDKHFDYRNALDNYARYADEIVVAINTSTDGSYEAVESYAKERGYPVKMVATYYDPMVDPFYYGKVVNAALQACTGDFMVQRDMDERWCGDPLVLRALAVKLAASRAKAFFIPTVDLYGDVSQYVVAGRKWYGHLPGLHRGAVNFGLKANGLPDYERTSTDELITANDNLVSTIPLLDDLSIEALQAYAARGMPYSLHLGFLNLHDRAERAAWWGDFWRRATGGDPNNHVTDVNELLKRETKPHGLPLWEPQP
jgi:hypothetical protein